MTSRTATTADYYHLLGISPEATHEEIRAAYRAKLRLWHPDLVADETEDLRQAATEMSVQLNEAYGCLSDPDRRAAYDTSRGAGSESTRRTSNPLLVSPRTVRCEVTPGDTVRLTLNVQADSRPLDSGLQVRTAERLVAANFTVTAQAANSVRLEVRLDTSELDGHRIYQIPIVVTWGTLTGSATLVVRTNELRRADSTSSSRRSHSMRRSGHRVRDMTTISLGGIVLPLLMLASLSGLLPVPAPANPGLIAAICAGVIAATIWLLMSSRLLRRPDRLAGIGVLWSHLMRWSGWILIGGCAVFLGIPAIFLVLMAVFAAPFFGLVVVAFISGRFDSQHR